MLFLNGAKKITLFSAILLILSTNVHRAMGEYNCAGSRETDCENIKRARATPHGKFIRLNSDILKFEGHIQRGSYEKYLEAVDNEIRILVINSPGGDSYDGVRIGLDLQKRGIDLVVDGVAGSSAANYLFTAGRRKTICRGFVGFHGNAGAVKEEKRLEESIRSSAVKAGLSREQIEKVFKETMAVAAETIRLEKEFFGKLGVSQKLFEITQRDAKGLPPDLGLDFEFLLPSIYTMEKFGIGNVEGRQNIELAELLGLKVIYY